MKVGFGDCGEIVSLSDFEIVAWTYARLPYSFLRQIFFATRCYEKEVYEAWFWENGESNIF